MGGCRNELRRSHNAQTPVPKQGPWDDRGAGVPRRRWVSQGVLLGRDPGNPAMSPGWAWGSGRHRCGGRGHQQCSRPGVSGFGGMITPSAHRPAGCRRWLRSAGGCVCISSFLCLNKGRVCLSAELARWSGAAFKWKVCRGHPEHCALPGGAGAGCWISGRGAERTGVQRGASLLPPHHLQPQEESPDLPRRG